jgi:hypothetical protein
MTTILQTNMIRMPQKAWHLGDRPAVQQRSGTRRLAVRATAASFGRQSTRGRFENIVPRIPPATSTRFALRFRLNQLLAERGDTVRIVDRVIPLNEMCWATTSSTTPTGTSSFEIT